MSTTDERDDGTVDLAAVEPAEGDDIVVIPSPGDVERTRRRRAAFALGGVVGALIIVGGLALIARNNGSDSTVVKTSSPTTIDAKAISSEHSTTTVTRTPPAPVGSIVNTVPRTVAPQIPVSSPAIVPPPTSPPIVSPTIAAIPQYGASVLTWTAPSSLTIVSGKTAPLAVTAHNPTNGNVALPHPLACTPRLDHSEMCTEMLQLIGAGQSASAQYTIDAKGIAPGKYTLKIEGVLTVPVTVS